MEPLLTSQEHTALRTALRAGVANIACSLDLGLSTATVVIGVDGWSWQGRLFPYLETCNDRTIYHWIDESFQPVSRYTTRHGL